MILIIFPRIKIQFVPCNSGFWKLKLRPTPALVYFWRNPHPSFQWNNLRVHASWQLSDGSFEAWWIREEIYKQFSFHELQTIRAEDLETKKWAVKIAVEHKNTASITLFKANIWTFISSLVFFTFYGYNTNLHWSGQLPDGLIAQLVKHRTGIAEVTGSNPVQAWIFFFKL